MDILFSSDVLFSFGVMGLYLLIYAHVSSRILTGPITLWKVFMTLGFGYMVSTALLDVSIPLNIRCIFFLSSTSLFYTGCMFYLRFSRSSE